MGRYIQRRLCLSCRLSAANRLMCGSSCCGVFYETDPAGRHCLSVALKMEPHLLPARSSCWCSLQPHWQRSQAGVVLQDLLTSGGKACCQGLSQVTLVHCLTGTVTQMMCHESCGSDDCQLPWIDLSPSPASGSRPTVVAVRQQLLKTCWPAMAQPAATLWHFRSSGQWQRT